MEGLHFQLYAFLVCMLTGICLGFCFDIYRILRGIARAPKRIFTDIGDILFCIIMGIGIYISMLYANYGQMRGYVIVALFLGCVIYAKLFSPWFLRTYVRGARCIRRLSCRPRFLILRILSFPFTFRD